MQQANDRDERDPGDEDDGPDADPVAVIWALLTGGPDLVGDLIDPESFAAAARELRGVPVGFAAEPLPAGAACQVDPMTGAITRRPQ